MEEVRIAALTLTETETETTLYKNVDGAIVKTILLYNSDETEREVTLILDGVTFLFALNSKETKILNNSIVVNSIVAKGNANIHISGIQL